MKRFFITVEYDGTGLVGWQRQQKGASVQGYLEQAAKELTGQEILVQGSGRTDAGVHALGQVAHLDVPDKFDEKAVLQGLNAKLATKQVKVLAAQHVSEDMHARFSATKRSYIYRILNRKIGTALHREFLWHVPYPLDCEAMRAGAAHLIGLHDFTSFRASACQAKSPIRTMDEIKIIAHDDQIELHASAISFLHNQIRNITGTLVQVGRGKWHPDDVKAALEAKDRAKAGPAAPPHGLYLSKIEF